MILCMILLIIYIISVECSNSDFSAYSNFVCLTHGEYSITDQPIVHPVDLSFIDYVRQVYNYEKSDIIDHHEVVLLKSKIYFSYRNADVKIHRMETLNSFLHPVQQLASLGSNTGDFEAYRTLVNKYDMYEDDSWVEVSRFSTNLSNGYEEGYTTSYFKDNVPAPYGCWFTPSKGSGIFINAGRVLNLKDSRVANVNEFSDVMDEGFCLRNGMYRGENTKQCYDKHFCAAANMLDYNSIHSNPESDDSSGTTHTPQFISCSGSCMTQPLKGTCPDIPMRTGLYAEKICNCSEESPILNCGHDLRDGGLYRDYYFQSPPHHSTSYYRPVACINFNDLTHLTSKSKYKLLIAMVTKPGELKKMNKLLMTRTVTDKSVTAPSILISLCLNGNNNMIEGIFNPAHKYQVLDTQTDFDTSAPINFKSSNRVAIELNHDRGITTAIFHVKVFISIGFVIINEERLQQLWTGNSSSSSSTFPILLLLLKRMIMDESMCLRTAGASTVIAVIQLAHYSFLIKDRLSLLGKGLVSYIDAIVIHDAYEIMTSCDKQDEVEQVINNTANDLTLPFPSPSTLHVIVPIVHVTTNKDRNSTMISIDRRMDNVSIAIDSIDLDVLCSFDMLHKIERQTIIHPVDLSFIDYVKQVYNYEKSDSIHHHEVVLLKSKIFFSYKNADVRIHRMESVDKFKHPVLQLAYLDNNTACERYRISVNSYDTYENDSWVEVSRFTNKVLNGYEEGFTTAYLKDNVPAPYGCWFTPSKGSGIFINAGRVLNLKDSRVANVNEFSDVMDEGFCLRNGMYRGEDTKQCYDKHFCAAANMLGYNSIHNNPESELRHGTTRTPQFISCSGSCMTQPLKGTCPDIPMRTGLYAEKICNCSEESPILNCGHDLREGGLYRDYYFQSPPPPSHDHDHDHHNLSASYYRPVACISFDDCTYLTTSSTYNLQLIIVTKGKTINKMNGWVFSSSSSASSSVDTVIPSSRCCLSIHKDTVEGLFNPLFKYKLMDFDTDFDIMNPIRSKSNDAITVNLNTSKAVNSIRFNLEVTILIGLVIINEERLQQLWTGNSSSSTILLILSLIKRMIMDESMCLRTAGASTVIAVIQLAHDSFLFNSSSIILLRRELVSYIDVIILIERYDSKSSILCNNNNKNIVTSQQSNVVPIVYINDDNDDDDEAEEHDSDEATVITINRANKVLDIETKTVNISTLYDGLI